MQLGLAETRDAFHWQHLVAWLGGMLCFMAPFVHGWELVFLNAPLRHGAGNFGFNLLSGIGLASLGAIIAGYWWRLGKWLSGKRDKLISVFAVLLLGLGLLGLYDAGLQSVYPYLVVGLMFSAIIFALCSRNVRKRECLRWSPFLGWLCKKKGVNVVFFLLLLITLAANDFSLVASMDCNLSEKLSIFTGRVFTHMFLVLLTCMWTELVMGSAPRYLRWSPWLILSIVPVLVILDQLLGLTWSRTLFDVVNSLTSSGSLDLAVELETSGLDIGPVGAWLVVISVYLLALGVASLCWLISRKLGMGLSMGFCLVLTTICWLAVVTEQGLGSQWKRVPVWQEERRHFDLHVGLFAPPQGLGTYRVVFHDGQADYAQAAPSLGKKPDVYIFILESVRSDAIRPDIAPFMSRFRDEECQPFKRTWAVSNATHLSWFGLFHSRVPVFWREAMEEISQREQFQGAYPLQQLKHAGYEIEVRAVCDLGYKDFGFSNFGYEKNLLHVLEQARGGNELSKLNIAEREVVTMEKLRAAVLSRPDGGLYITALDAPHYNYYWHEDFDPPFKEYDEDTQFPLNPSEEQIQKVVNRYWNSVAWVDTQIEQFCRFLKSQGRYDDSIIIITGDHGEEFQEQGSWFHCSSLRPEQIEVPILIKWPSNKERGQVCMDANHIDIMPTLLHALGMPAGTYSKLAGRNLLAGRASQTSISTTAYAGKSRETMVMHRDGYEAVFYWDRYWESQVPARIVLERLTNPEGELIRLKDASAYAEQLKTLFPDAFGRFFKSMEVISK